MNLQRAPSRLFVRPVRRGANPYTIMFADALAAVDHDIVEMQSSPIRYPRGKGVVILHWPDEFFASGTLHHTLRAWALLLQMRACRRLAGQRIVWVVHNLRPHDRDGMPRRRAAAFLALLDGAIYLSESARIAAITIYPALAHVPGTVVGHGDYRAVEHAAPTLPSTIGARPVRLALTGLIRRYKGADLLARVMATLPPGTAALIIAGGCDDDALADELRTLAATVPSLALRFGYLDQNALEATVDDADAIVLPYRAILNSGSALYALSRHRPVIAPRLGSLEELRAQVGAAWLYLYDGDLDVEVLADAVRWLRDTPRPVPPNLSAHRWDAIGATLGAFFARITDADHRTGAAEGA